MSFLTLLLNFLSLCLITIPCPAHSAPAKTADWKVFETFKPKSDVHVSYEDFKPKPDVRPSYAGFEPKPGAGPSYHVVGHNQTTRPPVAPQWRPMYDSESHKSNDWSDAKHDKHDAPAFSDNGHGPDRDAIDTRNPAGGYIKNHDLVGKKWADEYMRHLPSRKKGPWMEDYKHRLSSWQNDVVLQKECKPLTIIWALGRVEITRPSWKAGNTKGNIGAHPSQDWFAEIAWLIGPNNFAIQGVDRHTFGRPKETVDEVSVDVAGMIMQAIADCPDTKLVLAGFESGATIARLAAAKLSNRYMSRLDAFVTFCDNQAARPVHHMDQLNIRIVNAAGDKECEPGHQQKPVIEPGTVKARGHKYEQLVEAPARWLITRLNLLPGVDLDP